jgi:predicted nucleic acid-binding protein
LIDTNVVINHLAGNTSIERLLDNETVYISAVTFSEPLSKIDLTSNEEAVVRSYI